MDFFKVANQKARKAIDNVPFILNKIHLSLFMASLRRLFPSFISGIWPFWGLVIVKKQIDVSFLCVCSLTDDKFRHNIVKVYYRTTATLTMLWRNLSSI